MKNLNHKVKILISTVAVALVLAGIPTRIRRVVSVISGKPTSKGMPKGIDFMVVKIENITSMAPMFIV